MHALSTERGASDFVRGLIQRAIEPDAVVDQLVAALTLPLDTARNCDGLLRQVVEAALAYEPGSKVKARNVTVKLLTRIIRDLRCASILSLQGFPVQALTLVSCIFEVAFTVAYIRDDVERADEWWSYSDPTRPFKVVKEMIEDVVERYGQGKKQAVASKYLTYRQLCQAKHAHPELERRFGVENYEDRSVLDAGPSASDVAIRASWFAMTHAAGLTTVAVFPIIEHYMTSDRQTSLLPLVLSINAAVDKQNQFAFEQGWDHDPHPEQWRL